MDSPLPMAWWQWAEEDPEAASCALFLADVSAGASFGASLRHCLELVELEARVRADARYPTVATALHDFWRQAMTGLEVQEVPGRGQGLFVADAM